MKLARWSWRLGLVVKLLSAAGLAALELPAIFSDGMVLQRGQPVVVWGVAEAGEAVTVTLAETQARAVADADGRWRVALPPPVEGRALELVAVGARERVVVRDAVAGEVWLCAGQSNMEWPVLASADGAETLAAADAQAEGVRVFRVAKRRAAATADDAGGLWLRGTADNVRNFSAVGYHLARRLQEKLGVPVGVIDATFGGTGIGVWMPPRAGETVDAVEFARGEAAYRDAWYAWHARTQRADPGPSGAAGERWMETEFDDGAWPAVRLPDMEPGASVRLYRHTLRLDSAPAGAGRLSLGIADDFDTVWVNGVRIGATGPEQWQFWNAYRAYRVPPGVLRTGKNVIAVRLHDHGGGGGLLGPRDALRLTVGDVRVELAGEGWRRQVVHTLEPVDAKPGVPGMGRPGVPGVNFNAMIAPLAPYALAGVAWYQGESDTGRPGEYAEDLSRLAATWRAAWARPELPWLVVQLPNYGRVSTQPVEEKSWADFRAAQVEGVSRMGNAVCVPIIDLGEVNEIHPRAKRPVGERLATAALARVYGHAEGALPPAVAKMEWRTGGTVRVAFSNVGKGLRSGRGEALPGFALRGADGVWNAARARIDGTDTVVVSVEGITEPVELRYAWAGNPETDLRTETGQVVGPFAVRRP